jgi:hypothetical protein
MSKHVYERQSSNSSKPGGNSSIVCQCCIRRKGDLSRPDFDKRQLWCNATPLVSRLASLRLNAALGSVGRQSAGAAIADCSTRWRLPPDTLRFSAQHTRRTQTCPQHCVLHWMLHWMLLCATCASVCCCEANCLTQTATEQSTVDTHVPNAQCPFSRCCRPETCAQCAVLLNNTDTVIPFPFPLLPGMNV